MTDQSPAGRTVWLASFPKSGNTWLRAIVTALRTHRHLFSVDQLGSGSQPHYVGGVLAMGLDARWLARAELDQVRDAIIRGQGIPPAEAPTDLPPILRKTHEVYRPGSPGAEPFPTDATRAAILIVRDPRDVACSHAPFFGLTIDQSIDAMARVLDPGPGSPARLQTAQPWGSWSSHASSWLADDVPFPVHPVRYEDLKADAVAALAPVFDAIGMGVTRDELAAAVDRAAFDRLQEQERERGFRETSKKTERFFRQGRAGGWRTELTDQQVAAIEADHAELMERFGYELTTAPQPRAALAEARRSRRRQERAAWLNPPEHLGLTVQQGDVPDEIPGARRPQRYIQTTERETLVSFQGGAAIWVRDGHDITIRLPEDHAEDLDPSWLVQGWGVTLANLQRGNLSLHAATVQIGDQTVAIAGRRGAGKSTTSMALRARGHQLLVDDVTLIEFRDGAAWTTPFARNVHLLPDAAAALGVDFDALPLLAGGRTKAAFRAEAPEPVARRIDRVIVLAPRNTDAVQLEAKRGASRMTALTRHLARDGIAPMILGAQRYFELLAQLAAVVPVDVITRPMDDWTLDEVLARIEEAAQLRRVIDLTQPTLDPA